MNHFTTNFHFQKPCFFPFKSFIIGTVCMLFCMVSHAQWDVVYSDPNAYFYGVHAVDTNIIYACGTNGTIVKSTDGGDTWHKQTTPTTQKLVSIQFLDSLYGYAVGNNGTVLKTENGGTNWQSVNTGTQAHYRSTSIVSKDMVYLMGNFCKDTIFDYWCFYSDTTFNIFEGYIFPDNFTYTMDSSILLKTIDGGAAWQPLRTTYGYKGILTSMVFIDSVTGFIGEAKAIYKTTDGGENWMKPANNIGSYEDYLWTDICFVNRDTGYVGGWMDFLVTFDRGESFQTVDSGAFYYEFNSFLSFPTAQVGYMAGITQIRPPGFSTYPYMSKTEDFGQSWKYQKISTTIIEAHFPCRTDIDFPSINRGFFIAQDIYRTTNGGITGLQEPKTFPDMTLSIIPNPTLGKFSIQIGSSVQIKQLLISNLLGVHVMQKQNIPRDMDIDISHLPAGIYLLSIQTDSGIYTQKVIKQ